MSSVPEAEASTGSSAARRTTQKWVRWLHVYTSMVALFLVLFFAVTGITLNHPDWVFGGQETRTTATGTLPATWRTNGSVDWLTVAEHLRSTHHLKGAVTSRSADDTQAALTFKSPGYAADAFIDVDTGSYDLTVVSQGAVAVLNDLHKGRDTASSWRWIIDASALFLVVLSVTGLVLQFFIRRRRRSAYITAVAGAIIGVAMMLLTIG